LTIDPFGHDSRPCTRGTKIKMIPSRETASLA
jgi:hypothetical protein